MVTINFTIFVELGLFLIFLWGTAVFIFRPVLRLLDERERDLEESRVQSEADTEEAQDKESEYASQVAQLRREADETLRAARRAALDVHTTTLSAERHKADDAVSATREVALGQIDEQRGEFAALAPGLADAIEGELNLGGTKR